LCKIVIDHNSKNQNWNDISKQAENGRWNAQFHTPSSNPSGSFLAVSGRNINSL
jgi:hypothetical protein